MAWWGDRGKWGSWGCRCCEELSACLESLLEITSSSSWFPAMSTAGILSGACCQLKWALSGAYCAIW